MAIAPLQIPASKAYSDLGLMPSLGNLGKALATPTTLADLGPRFDPSQTPTAPLPPQAPIAPAGASSSPYAGAISNIESGGKYDQLGPVTKSGDRAYGKYQIMGGNIPLWTEKVFGKAMTPDQFLANPAAQDAVFNSKFGSYVDKYGPTGAAKAWFAGEGGMNNPNAKDQLGTSVEEYARRFEAGLGGQ
jgi:hypothetical protein